MIQKYQAFLKTVDTGSISRAAEYLGYTQSAVSRMIADIENDWQVLLLKRSRGGLSLTSEGTILLPNIRNLCQHYDLLTDKVKSLKGMECGLIRIGAFSSVSAQWLPYMIKQFKKQYPNIEFKIINGEYKDIERWLHCGKIDCGFLCAPFSSDFQVTLLKRDRLVAILPEDHPLSNSDNFPLEKLSKEPFIKARENKDDEIASIIRKSDFPIKIAYEADDDYAILAMVECGLGISILPELVTTRTSFQVCIKEFDVPQFRDIGIAVKNEKSCSLAVKEFLSTAKNYAESIDF